MPRARLVFTAVLAATAALLPATSDRPGPSRLQPRRRRPRASCRKVADHRQRDAHGGTSRRRGHRAHHPPRPRRPRARRLPVAQPRRGRPEHHRHRAVRRARRDPDRGAAAGADARRRRSVLHPGLRLRLHQDAGGGRGQVGRGGRRRRHGPCHPALPAARDPERLERDAVRRARPAPARRHAGPAGLRGGGRSGASTRSRSPKACGPGRPASCTCGHGFGADPASATLRLPTGTFDPLLGRSYNEIAMEGRSQHKSQEMGVVEARGSKTSNLRLVATAGPAAPMAGSAPPAAESSVFDGIDTSAARARPPGRAAGRRIGQRAGDDGRRGARRRSPTAPRCARRT